MQPRAAHHGLPAAAAAGIGTALAAAAAALAAALALLWRRAARRAQIQPEPSAAGQLTAGELPGPGLQRGSLSSIQVHSPFADAQGEQHGIPESGGCALQLLLFPVHGGNSQLAGCAADSGSWEVPAAGLTGRKSLEPVVSLRARVADAGGQHYKWLDRSTSQQGPGGRLVKRSSQVRQLLHACLLAWLAHCLTVVSAAAG